MTEFDDQDDDADDEDYDDPEDPSDQDMDQDDANPAVETFSCPHCGQEIYEQAEVCPACGQYISAEQAPNRKPIWIIVAVIICLIAILRWIK